MSEVGDLDRTGGHDPGILYAMACFFQSGAWTVCGIASSLSEPAIPTLWVSPLGFGDSDAAMLSLLKSWILSRIC